MSSPTLVIRGDDPRLFGPGGRVRAAKLFPLPASYMPLSLVPADDPELEELYDQMAELLAREDALEPESPTAVRIAELEKRVSEREARQADALHATFEERLHMPLGAGADLISEISKTLANADPGSDDSTADRG